MSTDAESTLRRWLRDQEGTPPYLEEILSRTSRQSQRRRWWWSGLRPVTGVPTAYRVAIAAAVTIAVAAGTLIVARPGFTPSVGGPPSQAPSPTAPLPSVDGSPLRQTSFRVPFSLTVPDDWTITDRYARDLFVAYRPMADDEMAPEVGIEVTIADDVAADPCVDDNATRRPPIGPTAADLAEWLVSVEPLRTSGPVPVQVAGTDALRVDEAFVATDDCPSLQLWRTFAGRVYEEEVRRYYIFERDGQRIVAVVVVHETMPPSDAALAEAVLQTLSFD